MNWENTTVTWEQIPTSEIAEELLEGLERYSADGRLLKVRLRWRPHGSAAKSFVTKDRLLGLEGRDVVAIARAVASYAAHLYEVKSCESRFEAQIQREFDEPPEDGHKREWRSVTFHLANTAQLDEQHDELDHADPFGFAPRVETHQSPPSKLPSYEEYADFVSLSRSDPNAFAMLVMQHSHDPSTSWSGC